MKTHLRRQGFDFKTVCGKYIDDRFTTDSMEDVTCVLCKRLHHDVDIRGLYGSVYANNEATTMQITREQCEFIIERLNTVDAPTTKDCNTLNEIADVINSITGDIE